MGEGKIVILEGELIYRTLTLEINEIVLSAGMDGIVEPEALHEVQSNGSVRFFVEFYRDDVEGSAVDLNR